MVMVAKPREHDAPAYRPDTGCQYAPRCLTCPYPYCLSCESQAVKRRQLEERIHEAMALRSRGLTQKTVAERFGVTIRTVQRWQVKAGYS